MRSAGVGGRCLLLENTEGGIVCKPIYLRCDAFLDAIVHYLVVFVSCTIDVAVLPCYILFVPVLS